MPDKKPFVTRGVPFCEYPGCTKDSTMTFGTDYTPVCDQHSGWHRRNELRAPVVEPEPCRYTQPDGTRCTRPGGPRHGMCGPHYWARDDEGHAPVVEPSPVCGARVDYHGGTCGRPVGHDEPCAPVVEPERMPCGHTHAAIVSSGEGTNYCGECVDAVDARDLADAIERGDHRG